MRPRLAAIDFQIDLDPCVIKWNDRILRSKNFDQFLQSILIISHLIPWGSRSIWSIVRGKSDDRFLHQVFGSVYVGVWLRQFDYRPRLLRLDVPWRLTRRSSTAQQRTLLDASLVYLNSAHL